MNALELLQTANEACVSVAMKDGKLVIRGETSACQNLAPLLREHKAELLALLAANDTEVQPAPALNRLWAVTRANGEELTVSFLATLAEVQARYPNADIQPAPVLPPAGELAPSDAAIVTTWLDAISETDEAARADYLAICARDPNALAWTIGELATTAEAQADPAQAPPTEVACCDCRHFTRDAINPRGGIGRCAGDSRSSHRNPALWPWPAATHFCRDFRPILEGDSQC